jgi:hypothetical protein
MNQSKLIAFILEINLDHHVSSDPHKYLMIQHQHVHWCTTVACSPDLGYVCSGPSSAVCR